MKTFHDVVNQPTVKDGSLKQGLAVTKLAQAGLDVTFTGSIAVQGKSLEIGTVVAAALIPAFDNKFDTDLNQLLELYSAGYVIAQQRNIAEIIANGGQSKPKDKELPLTPGSVLSAADFLTANLKLASLDTVQLYKDITSLLESDKTTKQHLLDYLAELHTQLIPQAVLEVYNEKVRKELELASQFAELTELGFSDIQPISENQYSAVLQLANAAALQGLTSKGYLLKDSQVNLADATIKVVFAKQVTEQ